MKMIKISIVIVLLFVWRLAFTQVAPDVNLTFNMPNSNCSSEGRMFFMPISDAFYNKWTRDVSGWNNWGGNLGGISGADAKCQNYAEQFGLPGQYEALIYAYSTPGGDRMGKHWDDNLRYPTSGALVSGNGVVLKVKDLFSGSCGRGNVAGSGKKYEDVILMADDTPVRTASGESSSTPEIVHGYKVHMLTSSGQPPQGGYNCNTWGAKYASGYVAWWIGANDKEIGAGDCGQPGKYDFQISCDTGRDHGIMCIGK